MERIPNDDFPQPSRKWFCVLGVVRLAYGVIQVIGWNFHFPTPTERFLRRFATGATLACILAIAVLDLYRYISQDLFPDLQPGVHSTPAKTRNIKYHESWIGENSAEKKLRSVAARMQNPAKRHPKWKIPMHILIPCIITGGIYTLSRAYMLVEDLV
jgi:hypothetical protein